MHLAIDTNRYTDFQRGDPAVRHALEHAAAIYVPLFVLAELRASFASGTRAAENDRLLTEFLGRPGVRPLLPDEATTRTYAALFAELRQLGHRIPTNDLWI